MTNINLAHNIKILTEISAERIESARIYKEAEMCAMGLIPGEFSIFVAPVQGELWEYPWPLVTTERKSVISLFRGEKELMPKDMET